MRGSSKTESDSEDGEQRALAAIAALDDSDRPIAEQLHELVKHVAPTLAPRTWRGAPAYGKGDQVLIFFQVVGARRRRFVHVAVPDSDREAGAARPISVEVPDWNAETATVLEELILRAADHTS